RLATADDTEGVWLDPDDAAAVLRAFGIPVASFAVAADADAAVRAAEEIGYPVVLKAASGDLVHKSDVGGVVLGLETADAVRAAFEGMAARLGDEMGGALVQETVPSGVETIVGV